MKSILRFWSELQRRNVPKGIISYVIFSWIVLQVISVLGSLVSMPEWVGKTALITLLILFPIWIIFSWFYELTPDGIEKTKNIAPAASVATQTGKKLNTIIIVSLFFALVILVVDRFYITERVKTQTIASFTPPVQSHSIAVLPFSDFSQNKDHEYFADGLSEELLNLLTTIQKLRVTSRTSSFSFKNTNVPISEIAKILNVNYVLEGSIRKAGDQLRITAQLIDAKTDKHIWSETFDRKFDNILLIQDEVAREVVNTLQLKLLGKYPSSVKTDPEAYALYLKAKHSFNTPNAENMQQAEIYLLQAISLDNNYTPAKILLANVYQEQVNFAVLELEEGSKKALAVLDPVIAKDPTNALALAVRGDIALASERNFTKARIYLDRALQLAPSNPEVVSYAAIFEVSTANFEKATDLYSYAVTLDPLNSNAHYGLGIAYYSAGDFVPAEAAFKKAIALNARNWSVYYYLAKTLMFQGRTSEALEVMSNDSDELWRMTGFAAIYYKAGDMEKSDFYLNQLKQHDLMAYQIAQVHALRKETDQTFLWLEKAYELNDLGLNEILSEPDFKPLYEDPRWEAFIAKLNFYR
ncbi:MAG: tetratricopeptide repeat protein [Marinirhabdus sp.]|nr:tetratricopeptide repeat protein [Marinirhabdus sp.]